MLYSWSVLRLTAWLLYNVSINLPGHAVPSPAEKSGDTEQNNKNLISTFACFLAAIAKV